MSVNLTVSDVKAADENTKVKQSAANFVNPDEVDNLDLMTIEDNSVDNKSQKQHKKAVTASDFFNEARNGQN